ncbi:hypothetical protein [Mesorhizobium sp. A623]
MKSLPQFSGALLITLALIAAAQAEKKPPTQAPLPSTNPCQVKPDDETANRAQNERHGSDRTDNLSRSLEPCGGVLKPPPTGDRKMATPPPAEGKTPIIRPGEIPQQPKQD